MPTANRIDNQQADNGANNTNLHVNVPNREPMDRDTSNVHAILAFAKDLPREIDSSLRSGLRFMSTVLVVFIVASAIIGSGFLHWRVNELQSQLKVMNDQLIKSAEEQTKALRNVDDKYTRTVRFIRENDVNIMYKTKRVEGTE